MFKAGQHSEKANVAKRGGGALSADRAALKHGTDGEFWPEAGKTWQRFYRTLNSKFYGERQIGNHRSMQTQYAKLDLSSENEEGEAGAEHAILTAANEAYLKSLDRSCYVQLDDGVPQRDGTHGTYCVKIIVAR